MSQNSSKIQRPLRIPDNIQVGVAEPPIAKAGEKGSWVLNFILAEAIAGNRKIFLYVHGGRNNHGDWENIQTDNPLKEGYVSLKKESGEKLKPLGIGEKEGILIFAVPDEGLKKGTRLIAKLGSQFGTIAPIISLPNKFFLLLTEVPLTTISEGKKKIVLLGSILQKIVGVCLMRITGNDVKRIRAYAKSQAVAGKEISLFIRPEDEYGNTASTESGSLSVKINGQEVKTECVSMGNSTCCILSGITLSKEGIYRLEVEDTSNGLRTFANPIQCREQSVSAGILWGMIHGHTEISDGAGSLDNYFTYMRDECGLDFGATGDHDHLWETSDDMWRLTQEKVSEYNSPGRFTVFLGYEWAKWKRNGNGDRNVYYLYDKRPLFRSDERCYPNPGNLFEVLKDETALIIPHHTAYVGNHCDWKDHDMEKERLVEIYSSWGNSERSVHEGNPFPVRPLEIDKSDSGEMPAGFVQRALELGWRVGFTAGGDNHSGHPGDERIHGRSPWGYKAGLTAVYAKDNTRESIWEAMWNRRCYGTTGARIIVDFSLNNHPMGSEININEHTELASVRKLSISVHGTEHIKSVEIVRNNKDVYVYKQDSPDVCFDWEDKEALVDINYPPSLYCSGPFSFYYVRITQSDGEMAWTSPIWILS